MRLWALLLAVSAALPAWPTPLELRSSGAITCDVCKLFAGAIEAGFAANLTESELLRGAATLCAKVAPDFSLAMCSGIIEQRFGPVVYAIAVKLGGRLPAVCEYIGACHPQSVASPSPSVSAMRRRSDAAAQKTAVRGGSRDAVKYIVQLSDVHFDQYYAEGSTQTCDFTLCCRAEMGRAKQPLAGHFGSYGSPDRTFGCDAPAVLVESAVNHIASLGLPISAVLLTGDYVSHDIWQNNVTEMVREVSFVTELVRSTLAGVPILPVSGNHEYFPPDQFILPQSGTQTQTEDVLNAYADLWSFLGINETMSLRRGGFYTTLIEPGLRYVGVNSQYGDQLNFWLYATNDDTGGPNQTAWLEQVLLDARVSGEKAIVASHIPCNHNGGVHDFYCAPFIDVVNRFPDVVVLVVAGHTHQDSWVDLGSFTQFVAPSITPFSKKNPAYRIYATNELNEVVRVDTYYLDLGRANVLGKAEWQLEYSLPDAYGMPDLSPSSFNSVAKQLLTNATLWDKWNQYHVCSVANSSFCMSEACKVAEYCTLLSPTLLDWNSCMEAPHEYK